MIIETTCPKCPNTVYIKSKKYGKGNFITDTKDKKSTYHRDTCPSGDFNDSDILESSYSIRKNYINKNKYRGEFDLLLLDPLTEIANNFNKHYSDILGGKRILLIKYDKTNYISNNDKYRSFFPEDYYKLNITPLVADSISGEELIWILNKTKTIERKRPGGISPFELLRSISKEKSSIPEYNKFYLFDRKININKELKSTYIYDVISEEITNDNAEDIISELIANEMNAELVDFLLNGEKALFRSKTSRLEELQKILDLKKEIGKQGEKFVLKEEIKRLNSLGLKDLARKVKQVSNHNVSAGYDIVSYSEKGKGKFIEVKTSMYDSNYFYMSNNEWEKAIKLKYNYFIYKVALKPEKRIIRIIKNPAGSDNKEFVREANSYKVRLF